MGRRKGREKEREGVFEFATSTSMHPCECSTAAVEPACLVNTDHTT